MDALDSLHPVPAAWLRDSDLAPFVPAYERRLIDRHYAANTVRGYLGHAKISDTYWYLTGTPELMDVVGARFERFVLPGADHE